MNILFSLQALTLIACLCDVALTTAKTGEFVEDVYGQAAPQEMVALTEQTAQRMGFEKMYDVGEPKKAALQVNPWSRFIAFAPEHPITHRPFFLINPTWFSGLAADEQAYLLGRGFTTFEVGLLPLSLKVLPYLFILLSLLLMIGLYRLMRMLLPAQYNKWWSRFLGAWLIALPLNIFFIAPTQEKIKRLIAERHDRSINQLTLNKLGNKEAAINALRKLHQGINDEIQKGETTLAPFANLFEEYGADLK